MSDEKLEQPLDKATEYKLGMFWDVHDGTIYLVKDGAWVPAPTIIKPLADICKERERQIKLRNEGRFRYTVADSGMLDGERLAVLGEEFGEVCTALQERLGTVTNLTGMSLRHELIQVAAVAVAWVERLDQNAALTAKEAA